MLKHRPARRQGRKLGLRLPAHPRVAHPHPGVLVLFEPEPPGGPRRQVHAGGVEDLPAELVLAVVVVVEVGSLGFGLAAPEIVPPVPFLARLPVVVPYVPGPDLLDRRTDPALLANDDLEGALPISIPVLEIPVRKGDLVPGVAVVLGSEDLASHPAPLGGPAPTNGHGVFRSSLAPLVELRVHPGLEIRPPVFGQKTLHGGLRLGDDLPYPLVVVRGGDPGSYLILR